MNNSQKPENMRGNASLRSDQLSFGSYLPENAEERMRAYVYRGTDKSLLYNYVWRPLCARLVTYLPVWLSANVITFAALIFVCSTHVLLAFYIPKFSVASGGNGVGGFYEIGEEGKEFMKENFPPPPSFVFILCALSLMAYTFLDNLDGHQARRTRMASPLGLIIDHGCDSFNSIILSLSISASTLAGPTWKTWTFLLCMMTGFFMNTWEEYYLGELLLPLINGANEGVMAAVGVYLFTAWMGGPQWWFMNGVELPERLIPTVLTLSPPVATVTIEASVLRTVCPCINVPYFYVPNSTLSLLPLLFGLNCSDAYISAPAMPINAANQTSHAVYIGHNTLQNTILGLYDPSHPNLFWVRFNTVVVLFFACSTLVTVLGNIIRVYRALHRHNDMSISTSGSIVCRIHFVHALTRLLPLVSIMFFATLWLLTSPSNIFRRHPRIFCWTFGLLFAKSSIHLMIAHICNAKFHPLHRTFWPFFFLAIHLTLTYCRNVVQWTQHYNHGDTSALLSARNVWGVVLDEEQALWCLFVVCVWNYIHLVCTIVRDTAKRLGIPVFTVPRSNQKALRGQIEEERAANEKAGEKILGAIHLLKEDGTPMDEGGRGKTKGSVSGE
ncbi:hypothetical protein ECC02_001804 [Trypanosoma cruzi]|uniref:Choline/ethanolamine phosphotransferase n=1 Tax=Trypanosoma cruzi TaxID=5693 RepID=A0A7J6YEX6_TRYCR|nr:hypothetical protein ECC02_001804 [Trypanosoma cruzi]